MSDADHDRMNAARLKRERKLKRYTDTPQAVARHAEMEREFEAGVPIPPPDPEIVGMCDSHP